MGFYFRRIRRNLQSKGGSMNEIIFSESGNTIAGNLANELYFKHKENIEMLKREVVGGMDSLLILKAKFWVIDSDCRIIATQSTREGALRYCNDQRVILSKGD
jgi:hypothetical protein